MFFILLTLAAGSLPTLISGAPIVPSFLSSLVAKAAINTPSVQERSASSYTSYGGSGTTSDGWPAMSSWVSTFDTMFAANKDIIANGCTQFSVPATTDSEMSEMSSAIQSVASSTGIDARFVLAIVLQESNGCVRAPTTNYGVRNPGLMQSHNGAGTCNDGSVTTPCPSSEITQMIQDGTAGTSSGDGLKQCIAETGASDVSQYYQAARIYNSGSIATVSGVKNLGAGIATHCYASDIANRLTGWSQGPSGCNSGTIAAVVGSAVSGDTSAVSIAVASTPTSTTAAGGVFVATSAAVVIPTTTSTPVVVPTTTAVVVPTTTTPAVIIPTTTSTPPAPTTTAVADTGNTGHLIGGDSPAGTSTSAPVTATTAASTSTAEKYYGAVAGCKEFSTIISGDICDTVDAQFGITLAQLMAWNAGLDSVCNNLWLGYQYCVKA